MSINRLVKITAIAVALFSGMANANAGWREELGTFRIGMLADPGADRMVAGLQDIKDAYATALGMPVQIFVARDYAALIDAHATGRIEYAIYSATAFATAQRLCTCVDPLVAPEGQQGDLGVRSILLVRKSNLDADGTLSGLRIAMPDDDSITGSIIPTLAMERQGGLRGMDPDDLVTASSETEAEQMFLQGKVDGFFGWRSSAENNNPPTASGSLQRLMKAGGDVAEIDIPWQSELLRYGPHALRTGIDQEAKSLLVTFLVDLAGKRPDVYEMLVGPAYSSLVPVSADDYDLASDIVEHLGE